MNKLLLLIVFLFVLLFSWSTPLLAKDLPIELSVDKEVVEIGDTIQLNLAFNNVQGIPAPELPEIEGFRSQYLGPSTVMSIINGKVSSSITHRYILTPIKTGKFKIGPFSLTYRGNTYKSQAKEVKVISGGQRFSQKPPAALQPQIEKQTEEQLQERIFLILSAEKTRGYINERIPIKVKLYVSQLAVRDIQYPTLEGQGYLKETFNKPRQYREELGGIIYNVIEFNTNIYATREGKITLGPAHLKCNIVAKKQKRHRRFGLDSFFDDDFFDDSFFGDFFSRYQVYPMDLKSVELSIPILPFPEEGKPREFSGAVGRFKMDISAMPKEVKAGDPITLKMEISGDGNFDSVGSPVLESKEGFKIYQPEVESRENTKVFEQVIIPQSEDITQIPTIKFSYFDPETKEYVVLKQEPIPISVLPAEDKELEIVDSALQQEASKPAKTQILGRDIVYIKENLGGLRKRGEHLYNNRLFMYLQLLPILFLTAVVVFQRRKERLSSDVRYARLLRAPKVARAGLKRAKEYLKNNEVKEFYDIIFKTIQEYLGHRFHRPSAGITSDVVDELIASKKVSGEVGEKLKMCFSDCDVARYAASTFDKEKMRKTLETLQEVFDYLERKKR